MQHQLNKRIKIIIAGAQAGGGGTFASMIASLTTFTGYWVPIKSSNSIDGWDSVLSILQMPNGVPVATVALMQPKMQAYLLLKY